MPLLPLEYLSSEVLRDVKFNVRPQCTICTEDFDAKLHLPKVLNCGHTFCVKCIENILNSVQVSYSGDGEAHTSFQCVVCRSSMAIPSGGASRFPNNFQLLDAIAPQDNRFVQCTNCKMSGAESSFHICRECTIINHNFDVHTIIDSEQILHPDTYPICSTCILREHNVAGHTIIDYVPIRLDFQFKKNEISTKVLSAQMDEKFNEVRRILTTMPLLVEKKEVEVSKMVELMKRAKTSQNQEMIFQKYKQEMGDIITILDVLRKDGGKLNELVQAKVEILGKSNEEINVMHCLSNVPDLKEVLKIPDTPEQLDETPHVPDFLPVPNQSEIPERLLSETFDEFPHSQFDVVSLIGGRGGFEFSAQNVINSVLFSISWVRNNYFSHGVTNTGNNENRENFDMIEQHKLIVGMSTLVIFTVIFCIFLKLLI